MLTLLFASSHTQTYNVATPLGLQSLGNIAAILSNNNFSFQGPLCQIKAVITIWGKVYIWKLTAWGHVHSPQSLLASHSISLLRIDVCADFAFTQKHPCARWQTHTHAKLNTLTPEIARLHRLHLPLAESLASDRWKLPSKPGPGGVQTVCLFEWTRHQCPISSAMLIK